MAAAAVACISFRWLELLEKEFDKAFVDLDVTLGKDYDKCACTYASEMPLNFSVKIAVLVYNYASWTDHSAVIPS